MANLIWVSLNCIEPLMKTCRTAVSFFFYFLLCYAGSAADPQSKYIRKSGSDVVIVFVHGFRGDSITTWTNGNSYWPNMIVKDHDFDDADVFVYNYSSSLSSRLNIDELADQLRRELLLNNVLSYRNLIFVAHSLGGIVVKQFLLDNHQYANHTLFLQFFGTPSAGSSVAGMTDTIMQYLSGGNPQLAELGPNIADEFLGSQARAWSRANFNFPLYCGYEKKETYGLGIVVPFASATFECSQSSGIDTDHADLVKPADENSESYKMLKERFLGQLGKIHTDNTDYLESNSGHINRRVSDSNVIINNSDVPFVMIENLPGGSIGTNQITNNYLYGNIAGVLKNQGTIGENQISNNVVLASKPNVRKSTEITSQIQRFALNVSIDRWLFYSLISDTHSKEVFVVFHIRVINLGTEANTLTNWGVIAKQDGKLSVGKLAMIDGTINLNVGGRWIHFSKNDLIGSKFLFPLLPKCQVDGVLIVVFPGINPPTNNGDTIFKIKYEDTARNEHSMQFVPNNLTNIGDTPR